MFSRKEPTRAMWEQYKKTLKATQVLIKLCVKSDDKDKAVKVITDSARTGGGSGAGAVGDGKIFIYPVAEVVRIRTGETNEAAI